jgi:hypothetical protein
MLKTVVDIRIVMVTRRSCRFFRQVVASENPN